MSWQQDLLDAQVSIHRAVFEMNAPGRTKGGVIRPEYIQVCIEDAIKELNKSLTQLKAENESQIPRTAAR